MVPIKRQIERHTGPHIAGPIKTLPGSCLVHTLMWLAQQDTYIHVASAAPTRMCLQPKYKYPITAQTLKAAQ